jgi:bacillithiol biosynthesis deacetylase BshB1
MAPAPTKQGFDIVAFGAHPDDVEMTMAGTVALFVRAGRSVLIVSGTRGEASTHGDPETREREAREAARILGASAEFLDFPDTRVENTNEARLAIARVVRQHRPSLVFAPYHTNTGTHHDGRANRDHMEMGMIVRDGLKLARFRTLLPEMAPHTVRRLLYFMVPASRLPSLVVDVSPVEATLRSAIEAYASQMLIQRRDNTIGDVLESYRRGMGTLIGRSLGEGFLTDEPLQAGPEELFTL